MKMTKKVVIWGADVKGRDAYDLLKGLKEVQVIAFGDNDEIKYGTSFCGKKVVNIIDVSNIQELDYVIIASSYSKEIYNQLSSVLSIPIYENVWELIGKRASIDITGWCNAQCKWCATGIKNRIGKCPQIYMSFEMFRDIYDHLLETSIIHEFNELLLYSWGEPFLNPDYINILNFLHKNGQVFSLSTNASVPRFISNGNVYKNCRTIIFSMSGFSQDSYNKIHGFDINKIKENITLLLANMRKHGFTGDGIISYHVYQFNINEISFAEEFARSLGLRLVPIYAYFASSELMSQYLTDSLSYEHLKEASKDLLLSHVDELIHNKPEGFQCLLENMISISTEGKIELCCCCDDSAADYEWKSIFKIKNYDDWKQMRSEMMHCGTCNHCRDIGMDYWMTNNPEYKVI